jgi:hypothetical protein
VQVFEEVHDVFGGVPVVVHEITLPFRGRTLHYIAFFYHPYISFTWGTGSIPILSRKYLPIRVCT